MVQALEEEKVKCAMAFFEEEMAKAIADFEETLKSFDWGLWTCDLSRAHRCRPWVGAGAHVVFFLSYTYPFPNHAGRSP